jgi:uncharacterized protein (DUF1919 family)
MDEVDFYVSAIIPVYNGGRFLARAIENIEGQKYEPLEIIVIDDGSTDDTAEIAAGFGDRIRYVYQTNSGPSAARNKGIEMAEGNAIAFLDVDDLWSDNKLAIQLSYLAKHPSVEIVQGLIQEMTWNKSSQSHKLVFDKVFEPYFFINLGSSIYRKSVFEKVGLFDETLRFGEDVDWFIRAWEQNVSKIVIDEVTFFYQLHDTNVTSNKNMVELGVVKVFQRHLNRQRKLGNSSVTKSENLIPLGEYIGKRPNHKIKFYNNKFTIISNDCWGGIAYQRLGLMYHTPFVGTRILPPCYLRLLKNLKLYLDSPLEFTEKSKYDYVNRERQERYFPIGILNNDVEIHFYHEPTEIDARRSWERRLPRINWDNLYIKFSDREIAWSGDTTKLVEEFDKLEYPYKLCFTSQPYLETKSTVFMPKYVDDASEMFSVSQKYFDVIEWLNKTHGCDTQAYLI